MKAVRKGRINPERTFQVVDPLLGWQVVLIGSLTHSVQCVCPAGSAIGVGQGAQGLDHFPCLVVTAFGQPGGGYRNGNNPVALPKQLRHLRSLQHQRGQRLGQSRLLSELETCDELIPWIGVVD